MEQAPKYLRIQCMQTRGTNRLGLSFFSTGMRSRSRRSSNRTNISHYAKDDSQYVPTRKSALKPIQETKEPKPDKERAKVSVYS